MIHVVLVEPQIPPNTGNIARLCAGLSVRLHLIKPLGFSTEDRYLKRAGLDYWPFVDLHYHDSLGALMQNQPVEKFYFLTTKSQRSYLETRFCEGDFLVFGPETTGLNSTILSQYASQTLTIPMNGKIRSLNLSSAVAMVVGEALRQINLCHP